MASLNVGSLGEYIREQRRNAQYSLRQLADAAGVSNPYLSQIERGLRKPSAEILQQIAKALRISAESLYVQAGILDERDREAVEVHSAILTDPTISERQKQVLLQIYESFRKENALLEEGAGSPAAGSASRTAAARNKAATRARARADVKATTGRRAGNGTGTNETDTDIKANGEGAVPVRQARKAAEKTAKTAKKVAEKMAGRAARSSRAPKKPATGDSEAPAAAE